MQIRILGCSGGIGGPLRTTCYKVDDDILIDVGTGVGDLSLTQMRGLRHIFLTHSHLDHIAGLPLMVDSIFSDLLSSGVPITLYAQRDTLEALRKHLFNWVLWPDFTKLPTPDKPVLVFQEMKPGEVLDIEGRRIEMVPVNHVVPGVGYCVEAGGKVMAFSGDTTTNNTLWEVLNRYETLHTLIVECAFGNQDEDLCHKAYHYCPSLLAADLAKLRHKPEIYLTHLKPGAEDRIVRECQALVKDHQLKRLFGGDLIQL